MIRLLIQMPGQPPQTLDWDQPVLTLGRAAGNNVVFGQDNVSSQHAQIVQVDGPYVFRDLNSTNGSSYVREGQRFGLRKGQAEVTLAAGDQLCLASLDNLITVLAIGQTAQENADWYENTIVAVEHARPVELESSLENDHEALRAAVRLARELTGLETIHEIAELTCQSCFKAFPKARRVLFLAPATGGGFTVECITGSDGLIADRNSTLLGSRPLLDRCLADRKGYLFLFEQNRMQAIATIVTPVEAVESAEAQDKMVLCCPLCQGDRCFGFIEVEAGLGMTDHHSLTRRDLSLVTLMGHLITARLHDLDSQRARLSLARKATAGYLAATVGHCFKNLLFVPMSLSKMLPLSIEQGKMDDVRWMLARNSVNIRYLDMLSNEFAAASKDPSEGFGPCSMFELLMDVAELVNQIAPEKVRAEVVVAPEAPHSVICHGAGLRRLLMNLTLNAVDALFGANKGVPGLIELRADFDAVADEICLTVRDNGPGIPEPILLNLRDIFRQVQASADALGELSNIAERVRSTKDQGFKEHYGLGHLFVCQTVHQHQGRMEIESTLGQGTCFQISFPRDHTSITAGAVTGARE